MTENSIIALIAVCIGGVGASIVTFALQMKESRRLRKKEKIEELYIVTSKWHNNIITSAMIYQRAIIGEISVDQAHDIIIDSSVDTGKDYERVGMYIKIYFPEIEKDYDDVMKVRKGIVDIWLGYKTNYTSGEPIRREWSQVINASMKEFIERSKQLEKSILQLAKCI